MRELGRIWAALAALGAGIVHLGAAARTPPALLVPLAVVGTAELVWAVVVLARQRAVLPAVALVVALLAPLAWVLAAVCGARGLPGGALAGASALDLAAAAMLALRGRAAVSGRPRVGAYLVGLILGAAAVAAIATASLSAGVAPVPSMPGMPGM